jgi:hypothetical protein
MPKPDTNQRMFTGVRPHLQLELEHRPLILENLVYIDGETNTGTSSAT